MGAKYKVIQTNSSNNIITMHPSLAKSFGLYRNQQKKICFGNNSFDVNMTTHSRVSPNTILIPSHVVRKLMLPLSCTYDLRNEGKLLRIGPFIGLLITHQWNQINSKLLKDIKNCVRFYERIGGAIIVFSLDGVNPYDRTIKGYYYDPNGKKWVPGVFGYPSSFMIKSNMISPEHRRLFHLILGKTFFNDFNLNKWQIYQMLEVSELKSYLPKSVPCISSEEAITFLEQYKKMYVKPIYGSRGKMIFKVSKLPFGALVQYRENKKNKKRFFYEEDHFKEFMTEKTANADYILQEGINLVSYHTRILDFRIFMVKNEYGKWENVGEIARYGTRNSIVSNISEGGKAEQAKTVLMKALRISERNAQSLMNKMISLAYSVAHCFDRNGLHCGNMGVDIGLDRNKKIWIIEVQHNNPHPAVFVSANDYNGYYKLLLKNMLYLKRLSRF